MWSLPLSSLFIVITNLYIFRRSGEPILAQGFSKWIVLINADLYNFQDGIELASSEIFLAFHMKYARHMYNSFNSTSSIISLGIFLNPHFIDTISKNEWNYHMLLKRRRIRKTQSGCKSKYVVLSRMLITQTGSQPVPLFTRWRKRFHLRNTTQFIIIKLTHYNQRSSLRHINCILMKFITSLRKDSFQKWPARRYVVDTLVGRRLRVKHRLSQIRAHPRHRTGNPF